MWRFLKNETVILASGSPRRNSLLRDSGLIFRSKPVKIDETLRNDMPIAKVVIEVAERKAFEAAEDEKEGWIIGADTVVVIDGEILGKPVDAEDVRSMLRKLSGRTHSVITGFSVLHIPVKECYSDFESTEVTFHSISEEEIEAYISTGEPFDKAGAYGIQGAGCMLVKKIDGCFFNVVGLPISKLRQIMKDFIQKVNNG